MGVNPSAYLNISLGISNSKAIFYNLIALLYRLDCKLMSLRNILNSCNLCACNIEGCTLADWLLGYCNIIILVNLDKILHVYLPCYINIIINIERADEMPSALKSHY